MSKLAEFKALEAQLAEQLKQLDALKNDDGLKREIEFETKLRDLMAAYDFGLREIVAIIEPQRSAAPKAAATQGGRRERKLKVYKNPQTGEVVETKGGNHKVLKAWKAEFGADKVEGWLQ
ncbi:DNA binding protein [Pseudomonas sp. PDM14]|uniref:histone-like nucleoid-structuring protein, MvaT/MvaU family n=1 Tax=Pseudomonas sp. PDM14 TaxID=2769288 RepID=UPI00177DE393|nr:histone-like nucleoid-structuring protein, MvaT/MvaU family [Pseudomonas sp. PDM14]MBD9482576.1 DNA binding protein [Pseudomonas sp. PDM14]